jgi:hypothetical protein
LVRIANLQNGIFTDFGRFITRVFPTQSRAGGLCPESGKGGDFSKQASTLRLSPVALKSSTCCSARSKQRAAFAGILFYRIISK